MTYRRRYLATLLAAPVVDLLLADETNPRSVLYQVRALGEHLDALPREPGAPRSPQQLLLYEATASIQLADGTRSAPAARAANVLASWRSSID